MGVRLESQNKGSTSEYLNVIKRLGDAQLKISYN